MRSVQHSDNGQYKLSAISKLAKNVDLSQNPKEIKIENKEEIERYVNNRVTAELIKDLNIQIEKKNNDIKMLNVDNALTEFNKEILNKKEQEFNYDFEDNVIS